MYASHHFEYYTTIFRFYAPDETAGVCSNNTMFGAVVLLCFSLVSFVNKLHKKHCNIKSGAIIILNVLN